MFEMTSEFQLLVALFYIFFYFFPLSFLFFPVLHATLFAVRFLTHISSVSILLQHMPSFIYLVYWPLMHMAKATIAPPPTSLLSQEYGRFGEAKSTRETK